MSILIIGLVALLLLIVSAILAITSVYLEYKRLQDVADQAALAVAQEVRGVGGSRDPSVQLQDSTVQELAGQFVTSTGAGASLKETRLSAPTGILNQNTAQVTLRAQADIPLISQVVPVSVEIEATGVAQTELSR